MLHGAVDRIYVKTFNSSFFLNKERRPDIVSSAAELVTHSQPTDKKLACEMADQQQPAAAAAAAPQIASSFRPPSALQMDSGNLEQAWKLWIQKFDLYLAASRSTQLEESVQVAMLLASIGDEALRVFNTFRFDNDGDKQRINIVRQKLADYCMPRKNIVFERYAFGKTTQSAGETIDSFVTTLRARAKTCQFENQEESLIRDRIVLGCADQRLQERLLREPDLTLIKALDLCRAAESTRDQMRCLKGDSGSSIPVHSVQKPKQKASNNSQRGRSSTCSRCGQSHAPKSCPAWGKQCTKCGKNSHFASVCRSGGTSSRPTSQHREDNRKRSPSNQRRQKNPSHPVNEVSSSVNDMYIGELQVDVCETRKQHAWYKDLEINKSIVRSKLDTGAEANVMSHATYSTLRQQAPLRTTEVMLSAYGNKKIKPMGVVSLKVHHADRQFEVEFYIVRENASTLLGLNSCVELQLVKRVDVLGAGVDSSSASSTAASRSYSPAAAGTRSSSARPHKQPTVSTNSLIDEFSDVFVGLGCMPGEQHIEVDPSVRPVVHAPRRVPLAVQPKLKQALDNLIQQGIIVKRDEPTDWVSSLLVVEKPNGGVRLCLDPRDLNKAIKREHYAIPVFEDIVPKLYGKRIWSIVDMTDAFYSIKLDEASSKLCTFNSIYGRYSFCRLPFGISSAPEILQKKNQEIFGDIQNVYIVFDDLLIAAADDKEHDEILRQVLDRARKYNIRFNRNKLQLKISQVTYLGHTLTPDGVKPDSNKVAAITEMSPPTDKKGVQRLLGFVAYLAKYIPNMSSMTEPLRQLVKKGMDWAWSDVHQAAFRAIQRAVTTAPVLRFFDPRQACGDPDGRQLLGSGFSALARRPTSRLQLTCLDRCRVKV